MSEIFKEDEVLEIVEDFDDIDVGADLAEPINGGLDARRRLENMLDERRLQTELDDFVDY